MSRIGKVPVPLPSGVSATTEGQTLSVQGPKGTLTMQMMDDISYGIEDGRIVVQPATAGPTTYTPSKVVTFKRGAPTSAKNDGQIPANYTEGSGTIVSGTTANKATTAALAAYPGGVVDRVVKLSNGEYEVHNIGVNWPHHIFVSKSFKVVGAN